jgi:hypothetical protein
MENSEATVEMIDLLLGIGLLALSIGLDADVHHLFVDVWVAFLPLGGTLVKVLSECATLVAIEGVEPHAIGRAELQREADADLVVGHQYRLDCVWVVRH